METLDRKGEKDIKAFVKEALQHFTTAISKIQNNKYVTAVVELKRVCVDTESVFKVSAVKVNTVERNSSSVIYPSSESRHGELSGYFSHVKDDGVCPGRFYFSFSVKYSFSSFSLYESFGFSSLTDF